MQAIILAAGMGKRLGNLTKDNTKCMVEVLGKTLIERAVTQIIHCGINKIVVVVGYKADRLKKFLDEKFRGHAHVKIEFVENPVYDKTNNIYSLFLVKSYLENDDTLLLESDLIFDESIIQSLLDHPEPNIATVAKFESWMDGTVVTLDNNQKVVSFIKKSEFNFSQVDGYFKTVNIYKFSKTFSKEHYVPFLGAYCASKGHNEYYEDALRVITFLDGDPLAGFVVGEKQKWYEIDDAADLDIAESLFATGADRLKRYQSRYGGYWRFPSMLDFCYLVNPYFPSLKLQKEIISNFSSLMMQYPSGQGVSRLIAAEVFGLQPSEILVGNGAAEIINAYFTGFDKTLGIVYPTFEEYPNRVSGSQIKKFIPQNDNFSYTADELIKFSSGVDQLLLINPDNPSGNYISKEDLFKILDNLKIDNKTLILDESFVDFTDQGRLNTLVSSEILIKYPNLLIIKSISKSYGVPGFRLGIAASSNKALLDQINARLSIWNVNSFGEFFLQIVDKYSQDYAAACGEISKTRKIFHEALSAIPFLRVIPSQANYFLCEVKKPFVATQLTERLLCDDHILIKDCSGKQGFNGKQYVRIAVRNLYDNMKLIQALQRHYA